MPPFSGNMIIHCRRSRGRTNPEVFACQYIDHNMHGVPVNALDGHMIQPSSDLFLTWVQ